MDTLDNSDTRDHATVEQLIYVEVDMERSSPQIVYAVLNPIPMLGALPGDEIVVSPGLEDYEVVVLHRFSREMAAAIPSDSVRTLGGVHTRGASVLELVR